MADKSTDTAAAGKADAGAAHRLVGAWRLVAMDFPDGSAEAARDHSRLDGLIMYDSAGFMSAQIITPAVAESGADQQAGSTQYHAYFGPYSVDEAASTVTHHRVANNNPDAPADAVRLYRFVSDDELILTPRERGGIRLTFRRAQR